MLCQLICRAYSTGITRWKSWNLSMCGWKVSIPSIWTKRMSLAQEHKHARLRATSSAVKKAKKKKRRSLPHKDIRWEAACKILTLIKPEPVSVGLNPVPVPAVCYLFVHLQQLSRSSYYSSYLIVLLYVHFPICTLFIPQELWGAAHQMFGCISTHRDILIWKYTCSSWNVAFFPSPPQNWSPSMSSLRCCGSRYVGLPPLSLTSGLHTTNRCSAANVRLDFTS